MEQQSAQTRAAELKAHKGQEFVALSPSAVVLSSSHLGWKHFALEQHRLAPLADLTETVAGCQVCLALSGPAVLHWRSGAHDFHHTVAAGEMFTANHGEFRTLSCDRPFDLLLFSVSIHFMSQLSAEQGRANVVELNAYRGLRDPTLESLLRLLRSEVAARCSSGRGFGEELCKTLALYLVERHCVVQPQSDSLTLTKLPGRTLQLVLKHIEDKIAQPIGIEELAQVAKISRFYFTRLFRNTTGKTPGQYILDRRMEHARQLLANAALSLKQVAKNSGFVSQSHFAAAFRSRNGVTPSRFRATLR